MASSPPPHRYFPVDIRDTDNFRWWLNAIEIALKQQSLWDHVEDSIPTSKKQAAEARRILRESITPQIWGRIPKTHRRFPNKAFVHLNSIYAPCARSINKSTGIARESAVDGAFALDAWFRFEKLQLAEDRSYTFPIAMFELIDQADEIKAELTVAGYALPAWVYNAKIIGILDDRFPRFRAIDFSLHSDLLLKNDQACRGLFNLQKTYHDLNEDAVFDQRLPLAQMNRHLSQLTAHESRSRGSVSSASRCSRPTSPPEEYSIIVPSDDSDEDSKDGNSGPPTPASWLFVDKPDANTRMQDGDGHGQTKRDRASELSSGFDTFLEMHRTTPPKLRYATPTTQKFTAVNGSPRLSQATLLPQASQASTSLPFWTPNEHDVFDLTGETEL